MDGMAYTSGLQKNADYSILRPSATALGQPARFLAPTLQKHTRELGGVVLCVRIAPVLPVPGRIHEEQASVWCQVVIRISGFTALRVICCRVA